MAIACWEIVTVKHPPPAHYLPHGVRKWTGIRHSKEICIRMEWTETSVVLSVCPCASTRSTLGQAIANLALSTTLAAEQFAHTQHNR